MELKEQVCSLELAKELKELGVKQDAYWSWYENGNSAELMHNPDGYRSMEGKTFDAFSVAELGEMLPEEIEKDEQSYWLTIGVGFRHSWNVHYRKNGTSESWFNHEAETEADARAKMLIYLLENKLIK